MYESTIEGKRHFVEERLEPLMKGMDPAIESVIYYTAPGIESVIIQNKNPDKNLEVNVACDSVLALVYDVMLEYFEQLKY